MIGDAGQLGAGDADPAGRVDPLAAAVLGLRAELLTRDQLGDLPAADPLIPGVLNRLTYTLLTGRDATYKTMLTLSWCLCLATGTAWHRRPVEAVPVLYLIGEGAYDFDARIDAWEQAAGVTVSPDRFLVLPRVPNLFKPAELAALLELIRQGGFGLVVVDTLRRASTGADMNGSDMARVVDSLEAIKRATDDGTVLVLAHTDKGDNDSRGFSGVEDDADTVWHCKREPGAAEVVVKNKKMRNGPDGASFTLNPRQVGSSIVLDVVAEQGHSHGPADQRVSPTARRVLGVLRLSGYENGATAADLAATAGVSRQRISDAMTELMASGQATRTGARGQYVYGLCPDATGQRNAP